MVFEVRPEQYVTGIPSDWGPAFQYALNDAKAAKLPIVLDGGKIYGVGSPGWAGLAIDAGHVDIIGHGATIKPLFVPSQGIFSGNGNKTLFKVTKTDGIRLKDVYFDLNALPVTGFFASGCNAIKVDGGGAFNGPQSPAADELRIQAVYFWAMSGSGLSIRDTHCHHIGFAFRTGHTNAGTAFNNVQLIGNRAAALKADFLACVGSDITVAFNQTDGLYTGIAASGYDDMDTTCSNIYIYGNTFKGMAACGYQSDIVRTGATNVVIRNVQIIGNTFESASPTVSGCYVYGSHDVQIIGNSFRTQRGIWLFSSRNFVLSGNSFDGGSVCGIVLDCNGADGEVGDIRNGIVSDNVFALGAGSVGLEVHPHPTSRLVNTTISGNRFVSGTRGLVILGTNHSGCRVSGNVVSGLSGGYDVRIEAPDVDVTDNEFATDGGGNHHLESTLPAAKAGVVNLAGRRFYKESCSAPTDVNLFKNTVIGRVYTIRATSGNLRLIHGQMHLKDGKNVTLDKGNVITLIQLGDGVVREMSRNF